MVYRLYHVCLTPFNHLYFYLNKVKKSKLLKIHGTVFIRNYGNILLGEKVTITSSFSKNPIGGGTFTSLVTENTGMIVIGSNSGVSNSNLYSVKRITIGDNVFIGSGCRIYDTDFHSVILKERLLKSDKGKSKEIYINNGVFIGAGCLILKGSVVGENSVIGANSVVTGNIPSNQVWAGNPAKYISDISSIGNEI